MFSKGFFPRGDKYYHGVVKGCFISLMPDRKSKQYFNGGLLLHAWLHPDLTTIRNKFISLLRTLFVRIIIMDTKITVCQQTKWIMRHTGPWTLRKVTPGYQKALARSGCSVPTGYSESIRFCRKPLFPEHTPPCEREVVGSIRGRERPKSLN